MSELIECEVYKLFYMYCIGYWLGMDVYDVGDYKVGGVWCELEFGMVLIVEFGIYVVVDEVSVDFKWCGIGICIEDDVLVIEKGCKVFIWGVIKDFDVIEVMMVKFCGCLSCRVV